MNDIEVVNIETGEVQLFKGILHVSQNGVIFIKANESIVVWCANAPIFYARTVHES